MLSDADAHIKRPRPWRRRRLASGLTTLIVAATTAFGAGQSRPSDLRQGASDGTHRAGPAAVADGLPVFFIQTPPILRPDHTGTVQVEIVYSGTVSDLRVFYARGAGFLFDQFPPAQTSTIGGRTVTIFRPSWAMGDFLRRFGLTIEFDGGVGVAVPIALATVPLRPDGFPTSVHNVFMRAMSASVGNVPVVQIDATAQYSSHVVNLVVPGLSNTLVPADVFNDVAAAQYFYAYFGDDYEHLAFVFREGPFLLVDGAIHIPVQNKISGIGLELYDQSANLGSGGRLEGVETYWFEFGNSVSNHELSHQWGSYFALDAISGISGAGGIHTPLWGHHESPLTRLIAPNLQLRPLGGLEWEAVRAPEPTQMPPLLAYAMGRLPTSAVPPMHIFENQVRPRVSLPGERVSGATRTVTIDQVIAHHGPRVGPSVTSVRRATILVSRDALATPAEMAYWTLLAQRLEDPQQTGMINQAGIGSFRAISGVTLNTRIIPPAGGPTLAGHATLEPEVLGRRDFAGIELDAAPRLVMAGSGIFRMKGRIVAPQLATATSIDVQHGGAPTLTSPVAADGSFSILGSPGLAPGRYMQRVFLNFGGGVSPRISEVRNVQYFGGVRIPPPPVALNATAIGSSVSIQWAADSGSPPTSYFLDVGSSPGAANIGSFSVGGTTLAASGVPNGQYYLRVRAANAIGVSAPSAETVLTVGCAPPQPPTMLTATVNGSSVVLGWQPSPTTGVSYTLIAGSTSGASNIAQLPVGTVTSLAGAVPAGRYFIRVRAVTPCGGADSNEVELVVGLPQLPGAPGALTYQVANGAVSLSWQAAAGGVDGYVLEVGSQPNLANLGAAPVGNVLTFSAAGVPAGTYYVRVRAFNSAGQGPPSNEVAVTVP